MPGGPQSEVAAPLCDKLEVEVTMKTAKRAAAATAGLPRKIRLLAGVKVDDS